MEKKRWKYTRKRDEEEKGNKKLSEGGEDGDGHA